MKNNLSFAAFFEKYSILLITPFSIVILRLTNIEGWVHFTPFFPVNHFLRAADKFSVNLFTVGEEWYVNNYFTNSYIIMGKGWPEINHYQFILPPNKTWRIFKDFRSYN